MADYTIASNANGAYEIPVPAGTVVTVAISTASPWDTVQASIMCHSGTSPVYAKAGTTIAAKDPASVIVLAGAWATLPAGIGSTVAITSANDAVVSVYRR